MADTSSSSSASTLPTQFVGLNPSALCSLLPRPLIISGILRDWLTRHFASADYIEEPDLRELIWKPGEDTGILIETDTRWRPELTEFRPGVILKRNTYQNMRRGIGDRRQGPPADIYGQDKRVTFWTGSHTLFCVGGTGAQAELLGAEVQRELTQFALEIARDLRLIRFQVTQIGAPASLEEAQENFVVPVTVGYTYEERWAVRRQSPLLSGISLSMLLEC